MSHIVRIVPPPLETQILPTSQDWADLQRAVALLESPTLTAKMANLIGSPLEFAVKKLPQSVSRRIHGAVEAALFKSAQAALWSMDNTPGKAASTRWHKVAAATSGALGGAFGFTALFLELPVSTTIMMRSVADVARSEGFDLSEMGTRHACLEVFALGGNSGQDDASETGYYITRGFTAEVMRHLSAELAGAAVGGGGVMIGLTPKEAGKWLAKIVDKLAAAVQQKGYACVCLSWYWSKHLVKCEIALGKGKKEYDKRDTERERDSNRELHRAVRNKGKEE